MPEMNCLQCGGTIGPKGKRGKGKLADGSVCPECAGQGSYYYIPRTNKYDMAPEIEEE